MKRIAQLLLCISLLAIVLVGCQDDSGIVEPSSELTISLAAAKVTIPAGSTFESAMLYVYVDYPINGQATYVHRVTGPWEETVVTWNNFGEAYDATVIGSFTATVPGWYSVDVTAVVGGWMNDTYENLGLLLKQDQTDLVRLGIYSRENAVNHPYLDICYSSGSSTMCETSEVIGDSHIWEIFPDENNGTDTEILTGWVSGKEKLGLLAFDAPEIQQKASLGDYVWLDENNNGIQDEGEMGMEGVVVHLMDCFGNMLAQTMTDADGYYLFTDLQPGDYSVHFVVPEGYTFSPMDQGMDDAMDSDADPSTGMTGCYTLVAGEINLTVDAGLMPVMDECAECDGKITSLTLEYQGASEAMIEVLAKGKKGTPGEVLFSGMVLHGSSFDVNGYDKNGTVGTEISILVNGSVNTKIHTSCSQPIYIGMVSGDFEILDGYSRFGGRLCMDDGGNGNGDDCSDCDGKITELTLGYMGASEATVEVYAKGRKGTLGTVLFSEQVLPGGSFSFVGYDKDGTMGTEISIFVDGSLNTKIHTSCSQPIYIGMVSGDFEILDGYSKDGGQLCPMQ
ncbi:MAG: SdrD B-like domain-containing protein [Candidatus Zixiibacteriota bacterium]